LGKKGNLLSSAPLALALLLSFLIALRLFYVAFYFTSLEHFDMKESCESTNCLWVPFCFGGVELSVEDFWPVDRADGLELVSHLLLSGVRLSLAF